MENIAPTQVGALVDFFWYAPNFNIFLACLLLWFAATFGLVRAVEVFTAGRLTQRGRLLAGLAGAVGIGALYGLSLIQKAKTVAETRQGIVTFMVESGWRNIDFEHIRLNINGEYTNNLLLAVGDDCTKPATNRLVRTSILGSLSLELINQDKQNEIESEEKELARKLIEAMQRLVPPQTNGVSPARCIEFTFREVDEVIFRGSSQLLHITTLRDYPECFFLYHNGNSPDISTIQVSLDPADLASRPLPFRSCPMSRRPEQFIYSKSLIR